MSEYKIPNYQIYLPIGFSILANLSFYFFHLGLLVYLASIIQRVSFNKSSLKQTKLQEVRIVARSFHLNLQIAAT